MIPTQNNKYLPLKISTIGLPKGSTDPKWLCVVHNLDSFPSWKFNLNFISLSSKFNYFVLWRKRIPNIPG